MSLEKKIHGALMNFPIVKKVIKRLYQSANVMVFHPKKSDGNIKKITPDDEYEYLFGYYDKSPWDASGRYMLCLRVKNASKKVAPKEVAEIVLVDTEKNNLTKVLAKTHTWNVQQGCMLGWLGPKFNKEIFYNDFRNGRYCCVIKDIDSGDELIINMPVYSVSNDGKMALSLDFARLHRLRPGYGYSNLNDKTKDEKVPEGPCVWKINLKNGKIEPILTYKKLYEFEYRDDMEGAEHKVNHLMLSPNGKRFMVIHRWLKSGKKVSRLLTCDIDGNNLYNLSDDDMVSHCCWKNNAEILAYCRKNGKNGYFLMEDQTPKFTQKWEWITTDGHPSYSPNGKLVVTDTYPNRKRIATLRVMSDTTSTIIAKVYAPFKYDNDTRCDLHPRWSRDGKKVCFDACFEGKRGVYAVESFLDGEVRIGNKIEKTGKIKVLFMLNSCKNRGPTRVIFNIIKNLDYARYEPLLLTVSEETDESNIEEILPYISKHYFCRIKKADMVFGKLDVLDLMLKKIAPDVIHTTGVFPDYAIAKVAGRRQVVTMHNYAPFDYIDKFGKIKGNILIKMQYFAAKHAAKTVACSKSLSRLYSGDGLDFDYIRNGIDVEKFRICKNKDLLRKKFGIRSDAFVFVYTGKFITRKNVEFALDSFVQAHNGNKNSIFILLGDGPELPRLRNKYAHLENIIFIGRVLNVDEYLQLSDMYVSASKSEGLPNGVLEAMACGLPVLLSNIPQHLEILNCNSDIGCGYSFSLGSSKQLVSLMEKVVDINKKMKDMSYGARKTVEDYFDASVMSVKYQEIYDIIANKKRITLFIGSLSGGGAERVTCNLANYLNENGYKIDVITMSNKRDTYKLEEGVNRICLLEESERSNVWRNYKLRQERLKQYVVANQDISCYVVMLPITIFMLIRLKKFTNSKMVISERNNPDSYNFAKKAMMKYASKRCDGLVVQTNEIAKWYGGVSNKVVIPNAINSDIVFPKRGRVEKKIVAVGRLEKQKNYPMLIKAFEIFSKEHSDYKLEIYGQGRQKDELKRMISQYHLEDKAELMGYVDNISECIARAACFVMTSSFEGMPNALIEAMCIGVPCIATDSDGGGVRDLITNNKNGIIIKKDDVTALVRSMNKIISNEEFSDSLSSEAVILRRVLFHDKIYNRWANYIDSIINCKKA